MNLMIACFVDIKEEEVAGKIKVSACLSCACVRPSHSSDRRKGCGKQGQLRERGICHGQDRNQCLNRQW